ncbi:MAG TPA: biopolymer transporter ExbD [Gammaproteobacteria bacterium]|jgi:biopolymer transport protein ExbD
MRIEETKPVAEFENILPLVNIVFLLLIFFMLAGAFSSPDLFKVEPPTATHADREKRRDLILLLDRRGRLALDGKVVTDETLRVEIARHRAVRGGELTLKLKADSEVDSRRLIELMEILQQSGLEKIRLLTQPLRTDAVMQE